MSLPPTFTFSTGIVTFQLLNLIYSKCTITLYTGAEDNTRDGTGPCSRRTGEERGRKYRILSFAVQDSTTFSSSTMLIFFTWIQYLCIGIIFSNFLITVFLLFKVSPKILYFPIILYFHLNNRIFLFSQLFPLSSSCIPFISIIFLSLFSPSLMLRYFTRESWWVTLLPRTARYTLRRFFYRYWFT